MTLQICFQNPRVNKIDMYDLNMFLLFMLELAY